MAKDHKAQTKSNLAKTYDASGRSLLEIEEEKAAVEAEKTEILKNIDTLVRNASSNGILVKEKFLFIHVNTLCVVS